MVNMSKLTPKQQAFVDFYIQTMNATQSYKMAGYEYKNDNVAGVSAHKLLKDAKIQQAIEERMQQMQSDRIASAEEVLGFLTTTMRNPKVRPQDRINSAELLGKRYSLWIDKVDVDANVDIEINLTGLEEEAE
jgi:phage terminase small subunit